MSHQQFLCFVVHHLKILTSVDAKTNYTTEQIFTFDHYFVKIIIVNDTVMTCTSETLKLQEDLLKLPKITFSPLLPSCP